MALYNINDLKTRHLRTPPVSHRRLENVSLELDVPLEHLEDETLPLVSHETLGVGYGFDRLYAVDLKAEKPIPYPLPSRHEITKHSRTLDPSKLAYGGIAGMFGGLGPSGNSNTLWSTEARGDFDNYARDGTGGVNNNQAVLRMRGGVIVNSTSASPKLNMSDIAEAFIGSGSKGSVNIGYQTMTTGIGSDINIDPSQMNNMGLRQNRNLYQMAYSMLTPSAWEMVLADRQIWAEIPKALPYLDKAFFSLYERNRMSAFQTRIRDPEVLLSVLGMVETMYSIRMGRFSKNVSTQTTSGALPNIYKLLKGCTGSTSPDDISNGVVNPFFMYMENGAHSTLIAPWWLIQKMNHILYEDTTRDEEIRDVERGDITQMFSLLTEAMEVERGLTFSSDSSVPMLVFDKYSEGALRDFSNFKDTTASLAATMLGFDNPRDAYYNKQNPGIGRLPYYSSLLTSSGTIIGKEKNEFLDRVKEQSEHNFLSPSPANFKQGMQYANGFDYSTMVTRTRFGDHSMELKVHPFGWFRGVKVIQDDKVIYFSHNNKNGTDSVLFKNTINLCFYPIYNWGQLTEGTNTHGLLPDNMNGAAYATGLTSRGIVEYQPSSPTAQPLWPANYHRPGVDNYSALLLRSTDEMFKSWMDRGDTVRAEGAVFPALSPVNMMAEMTFTTPLAMFQRNFPYLRKMFTRASTQRVPSASNTSFDFLTLGDNYFGMSSYHNAAGAGPLALRDRELFSTAAHLRTGEVQLAPMVVPMNSTPENWVALFQMRDAFYFLTSLLSEPIMDAYTSQVTTTGPSNGYGSARIVVYQGPKTFEGIVTDVFCTPLIGTGDLTHDYTSGAGIETSVFPTATGGVNNYVLFLLSPSRLTTGLVLYTRHTNTITTTEYPSKEGVVMTQLLAPLTEDDFVPGLHWNKKWLSPWPTEAGEDLSWQEAFSTPDALIPQAAGPQVGYMAAAPGASNSYRLGDPALDPLNQNMDYWRVAHGAWLETIRSDLEFQRASPTFYVIDLDITDITEALFRSSLFPLGKSTVGPVTFIGGLGPEGQQTLSETVTGPSVFEVIDLSTGAGDIDMSSTEPDDLSAGEENPSMHIASQREV